MTRVVVTGIGAITPLGIGAPAYWEGLTAGRSGIRYIQNIDTTDLKVKIAGEVDGFDPKQYMDFKAAKRMDRFAQFAVAAAREAVADAKLEIDPKDSDRVGVVLNTGGGGIPAIQHEVMAMASGGPGKISPFLIPIFAPNMASCQVSIALGIHGPSVTSAAACASGIQAFIDAVHMIQRGEVDVVITGGTEAGITAVALTSLSHMTALSHRNHDPEGASRPFDKGRDGFVFAEGSAVMVLESEEHAARRGARVICEVLGGGMTSDAFHITAPLPDGSGAASAMRKAMKFAKIEPTSIDYIAAHATATPLGDIAETSAVKQALGDHAYNVSISANKSMIGHLLGAAGAVSALSCVLAIRDGVIPPTRNLTDPDPECDLDYTPNVSKRREVNVAMANGFGFGGQNASCLFAKI